MQNDTIDNLRLDLNRKGVRGGIYVRAGDTRARTIHITLTNNGSIVDLSEAVFAELLIKKPDLNENDQTMVRYGNELQYTFRTQDINVPGECRCQAMVTFADGTIFTSPEFSVMVYEKTIDPSMEESMNEYTAIQQVLVEVNALKVSVDGELSEARQIKEDTQSISEETEEFKNSASDYAAVAQEHSEAAEGYAQSAAESASSFPTNLSAFNNDAGFITKSVNDLTNYYKKTETYSSAEVDTALGEKVDKISGKGLSTNDYTTAEKNKLSGIESGAKVNVQPDWTQSNSSADDYIKNKPNIPDVSDYYDKTEIDTALSGKVDKVSGKGLSTEDYTSAEKTKLSGIASGAEVNVQSDWNQSDSSADDYIKNKPTVPAAQIQSDWDQADNTKADYIKNKPDISGISALASRVAALEGSVEDILAVLGYPYDPS